MYDGVLPSLIYLHITPWLLRSALWQKWRLVQWLLLAWCTAAAAMETVLNITQDLFQILLPQVLADVVNTLKIPAVWTFEVSEEEGAGTRIGVGRSPLLVAGLSGYQDCCPLGLILRLFGGLSTMPSCSSISGCSWVWYSLLAGFKETIHRLDICSVLLTSDLQLPAWYSGSVLGFSFISQNQNFRAGVDFRYSVVHKAI